MARMTRQYRIEKLRERLFREVLVLEIIFVDNQELSCEQKMSSSRYLFGIHFLVILATESIGLDVNEYLNQFNGQ